MLLVVCNGVGYALMTDAYRRLAHASGWIHLTPRRLAPVVVTAFLVFLSVYLVVGYGQFQWRYGGDFWGGVFLGALGGGTRYFAIWLLAFHLYHYARRSVAAEAAAAEARLARLATELNPHFLFNALNGIKALTREDPVVARTAIDRLSRLLRTSLGHSRAESVPLAEELQLIRDYTDLEQLRLEERLRINWRLADPAAACRLPPFSLHALVENAIKHGIAQLPAGGEVVVRTARTANHWQLSVTNDGHYRPDANSGSGLKNLRERLALLYGPAASLTVFGHGSRTTAELLISHRS